LHPALGDLYDPIAELFEKPDAFLDVERGPFVLVVLQDGEGFVELRLRGRLDAMLCFRDGGGALLFGDDLSHDTSLFYGVDSAVMVEPWPVEIKNSRTSSRLSQIRAGGRLRRKSFP
jgi:hypothetical protein